MIDFTLNYFQPPSSLFTKYLLTVLAVILVGLGSGIYLVANLGPGPRDGLMTGLTKTTNLPIALVRAFLEITVVIIGWYLGCLLYTSPSPRDATLSRMPSSA